MALPPVLSTADDSMYAAMVESVIDQSLPGALKRASESAVQDGRASTEIGIVRIPLTSLSVLDDRLERPAIRMIVAARYLLVGWQRLEWRTLPSGSTSVYLIPKTRAAVVELRRENADQRATRAA